MVTGILKYRLFHTEEFDHLAKRTHRVEILEASKIGDPLKAIVGYRCRLYQNVRGKWKEIIPDGLFIEANGGGSYSTMELVSLAINQAGLIKKTKVTATR